MSRVLLTFVLVLASCILLVRNPSPAQGPTVKPGDKPDAPAAPARPAGPTEIDVNFHDGSLLKLHLLDEHLELVTPYGPLRIPARSIRSIEFGMRLTDDERAAIDMAIKELMTGSAPKRESAKEALRGFGVKAVPSLRRATKDAGEDALAHLENVLDAIPNARPTRDKPEEIRDQDVVTTDDSTISGRLTATGVRVKTHQFGEQTLKFAGIKSMGNVAVEVADNSAVEDAPPNMGMLLQRKGQTVRLRVTAAMGGTLWGTGTYTLDSYLPMAVIHMGLAQAGQSVVVKVRITDSLPNYVGSVRNGVQSHPYGPFPSGSFEILSKPK